jgi:HNH endonuclease
VVTESESLSETDDAKTFQEIRRSILLPDTSAFPDGRAFLLDRCVNCLSQLLEETDGLYCSDWCNETAGAVRYLRATYRDGRMDKPEVKEAINISLAFIMAGSYSALERTLSPSVRAAVKERDSGLCQSCGKRGAEIDHISGSSAELSNLQLLCNNCHREKTMENMVPAPEEEKALIAGLFIERVFPDVPKLLADDEKAWKGAWMALKNERRERLRGEIESLGISLQGLKSRAGWISKRDSEAGRAAADPSSLESDEFEWGFGEGSYLDRL